MRSHLLNLRASSIYGVFTFFFFLFFLFQIFLLTFFFLFTAIFLQMEILIGMMSQVQCTLEHFNWNIYICRLMATTNSIHFKTYLWPDSNRRGDIWSQHSISPAWNFGRRFATLEFWTTWNCNESEKVRHGAKHKAGLDEANTRTSAATVSESKDAGSTATSASTYVQVNLSYSICPRSIVVPQCCSNPWWYA